MPLYCGITKLHRTEADLTRRAVKQLHMTRDGFREKYAIVYDKPIPDAHLKLLIVAEAVRDSVLHGKGANDDQKRNAVAHALEYAKEINEFTVAQGGPRPFGDLRGFKGAGQCLEKGTTRWVLKGMGFSM